MKKQKPIIYGDKTLARFFFEKRNKKVVIESSDFLASSFSKRRSGIVTCHVQTIIKMKHMDDNAGTAINCRFKLTNHYPTPLPA